VIRAAEACRYMERIQPPNTISFRRRASLETPFWTKMVKPGPNTKAPVPQK
jgi:hypothetical protein